MHILHTVLYTYPKVLKRRICLTIKIFLVLDYLLYCHIFNMWFRGNNVWRKWIKGLKELKATHYLRPLLYILFSFCKEMHNSVCLTPMLHYMYMQATLLVMRNLLLFLHVSLQSKYLEYQVYLPTTNRK